MAINHFRKAVVTSNAAYSLVDYQIDFGFGYESVYQSIDKTQAAHGFAKLFIETGLTGRKNLDFLITMHIADHSPKGFKS